MNMNLDLITLCAVSSETLDAVQRLDVLGSPLLKSIETIGLHRNDGSPFKTNYNLNTVRRYTFSARLYFKDESYQTVSMVFDFDSTFHYVQGDINKSIYLAEGYFVTCEDSERKNELDTSMVQFASKCIEVVFKRESKNEQHSDLRYDPASIFKINLLSRDCDLEERISIFINQLAITTGYANLFVKHIALAYSTNECSTEVNFTLDLTSIKNRCYELFFEGKLSEKKVTAILKKAAKEKMVLQIDVLQVAVTIANNSKRTPQRFSSDELYYHYIKDLQTELIERICENPYNLYYSDLLIEHRNKLKYLMPSVLALANKKSAQHLPCAKNSFSEHYKPSKREHQ